MRLVGINMDSNNHWLINAGLVMPKPPKFSNGGYTNTSDWVKKEKEEDKEPKKRDIRTIAEYAAIKSDIEILLRSGIMHVYPHLEKYDITPRAKRDHIERIRKKLGIRRVSLADKVMKLVTAGNSITQVAIETGADKDYIKQVIKRRNR